MNAPEASLSGVELDDRSGNMASDLQGLAWSADTAPFTDVLRQSRPDKTGRNHLRGRPRTRMAEIVDPVEDLSSEGLRSHRTDTACGGIAEEIHAVPIYHLEDQREILKLLLQPLLLRSHQSKIHPRLFRGVDLGSRRARQGVCNDIACPFHMLNITSKFSNERELSGLPRRTVCRALEGKGQRFMVCKHCKNPALKEMTKVFNSSINGQ